MYSSHSLPICSIKWLQYVLNRWGHFMPPCVTPGTSAVSNPGAEMRWTPFISFIPALIKTKNFYLFDIIFFAFIFLVIGPYFSFIFALYYFVILLICFTLFLFFFLLIIIIPFSLSFPFFHFLHILFTFSKKMLLI